MNYARHRLLQCSHLVENFVQEHFEGTEFYMDYEDIRPLGKGGFGSVYLCRHLKSQIEFARKHIPMLKINSHNLQQLHTEISVMKEADHPHIIKLREVYFGRFEVNLIMELCSVSVDMCHPQSYTHMDRTVSVSFICNCDDINTLSAVRMHLGLVVPAACSFTHLCRVGGKVLLIRFFVWIYLCCVVVTGWRLV